CPVCGPHIELWDADGQVLATHHDAISACADALRAGKIVALKGLGGFHLLADATHPQAIATLRQRKHRPHKPFAVMFPTIDAMRRWCVVDDVARDLLTSAEAPIVLLEKQIYPYSLNFAPLYGRAEARPSPRWIRKRKSIFRVGLSPLSILERGFRGEVLRQKLGLFVVRNKTSKSLALLAPDNPTLGVMLPYTPLHHLLLSECGFPLIATSGNRADEPICIDEHEALTRLRGIADLFLVHNRPIQRPIDDSVVRVMSGRVMMIRRARGYAPLPIKYPHSLTPMNEMQPHPLTPSPKIGEGELVTGEKIDFTLPLHGGGRAGDGGLAVGAHLKNAIAIRRGDDIFISQHIGDLSTAGAHHHFEQTITDLFAMLDVHPQKVICDAHPDYASTTYAHQTGLPIRNIQHHYAHALACLAENGVELPALAVVWDGTGYGDDGTIWGGEFLRLTRKGYERVAYLRPFPLIGGDSAVIEPRKTALGWLYSLLGDAIFEDEQYAPVRQFTSDQRRVLRQMVKKKVNCPMTSSMGRLFDAVASLMDVCHVMTHEAQAAIVLENLLTVGTAYMPSKQDMIYHVPTTSKIDGYHDDIQSQNNTHIIQTYALLTSLMAGINANIPKTVISQKFHVTLIEMIIHTAYHIGEERVLLTGGCFLNKPLLEGAINRLREAGFTPYWHSQVPTGDGGICFGQAVAWTLSS
ncbi:MAG: carbamoyltransferase HypF, partial [Anaerolineae bacterium]|nr:carbamoyltransferase HypF [Anaerolineae bacterium]